MFGTVLVCGALLCGPARAVIVSGTEGGALADPRVWPTAFLFTTGTLYCSAVVIGPQVLLTAAQCVANQSQAGATRAALGDVEYRINCSTHPKLDASGTPDFALCKTDRALPVARIERVATSRQLSVGLNVTLVGYGCRDGSLRNFDGLLSAGEATIEPQRLSALPFPFVQLSGAVACSGDSGGGAFIGDPSTRILVGIISRSDTTTSRTWIAATANNIFLDWARLWSSAAGVAICGVDADDQKACGPLQQQSPAATDFTAAPQPTNGVLLAQPTSAPLVVARLTAGKSNTQPLRRVTFLRDEKLADVVLLTCGTSDDAFLQGTLDYLARQGEKLDRNYKFTETKTLSVPICSAAPAPQDRLEWEIKESDKRGLWFYFDRLKNDPRLGKWDYRRPQDDMSSPKGRDSPYYEEAFVALNTGTTGNINPSALKVGKIILPLRQVGEPAALLSQANQWYEPIIALQSSEAPCEQRQNNLTYPFDVFGLLDVLASNAENRREPTRETGSARVVIIDSGLQLPEQRGSFFRGDIFFFYDLPKPRPAQTFVPRLEDDMKAAHGTWVTSAALGGPLLARLQAASTGKPRIRIDPYRLHEERPDEKAPGKTKVIVPTQIFDDIFNELAKSKSGLTIVNLSLTADRSLPVVEGLLGVGNTTFLIVAAAGNGIGVGPNNNVGQLLKFEKEIGAAYPAAYGGNGNRGQYNLIVVAALYRDSENAWRRAKFSDYNPRIVEIGAPGCAIPVLHYDKDKGTWTSPAATGTSFAAPLVSFTAALISAEFKETLAASKVKRRILAAADLNPQLVNCIADGRALNVLKALAVRQDVIELRSTPPAQTANEKFSDDCLAPTDAAVPPGLMLRGDIKFHPDNGETPLEWNQNLPVTCDQVSVLALRSILKIAPSFNVDRRSPTASVFPDRVYVERGDQMDALDCKMSETVAVYFRRPGATGAERYGWGDLRDIVLRIPDVR
jgi:hypothetical protein